MSNAVGVFWHSSYFLGIETRLSASESCDSVAVGDGCSRLFTDSGSRNGESESGSVTGRGAKRILRVLPGTEDDLDCLWACFSSSSGVDEGDADDSGFGKRRGEQGRDRGMLRGEGEGEGLRRMLGVAIGRGECCGPGPLL